MKLGFVEKYRYSAKKKIRRIEYLGYPSFQKYLNWRGTDGEGYVTWTPRWSFDPVKGGSTFVLCKDRFIDFIRRTKRKGIFRPHPLIYDELMRSHIMTDEEWNDYLGELKSLGVIVDIESPIDDILKKTDILISDFSSMVMNFFMTGRPIIYYENGVPLNEDFLDIMKHNYVAYSWEDVEKYYDCISNGNDYLRAGRDRYIETKYGNSIGSVDRIVDCICEDWKGKK
jgi:CDP-glycerol glycerophosphotransferase (TagB/SpsB family)